MRLHAEEQLVRVVVLGFVVTAAAVVAPTAVVETRTHTAVEQVADTAVAEDSSSDGS